MSQAPIFAIVVGINAYTALPKLQNSVGDAEKVTKFLREELQATDIIELYDSKATKDEILKAITSLPSKDTFKVSDAVLFFFSGLAGKAPTEKPDSFIGTICPVDTNEPTSGGSGRQTGITDSTLIGLFDQISRSHGNNMTLFLDCDSDIFNWGTPDSCVIVTPEVAAETDNGGVFAKSLLNVLRAEKKANRIRSLTVQSLAKRIEVDNSENRAVHCFGKNANRFLLDRRGGPHHSFISGQKEIGGRITLSAGAAQGIGPGTRLAFFVSDVKDEWNKKWGYLDVSSASATSAIVRRSPSDDSKEILPDVFYAVETQHLKETIQVRFEGEQPSAGPFQPKSFSWVNLEQDKPNITLKFEGDSVTFFWNGLGSDSNRRGNYQISKFKTSKPRLGPGGVLKNAARFIYHLSRPSPDSALVQGLHIRLRKITGSGKQREPSGEDLLQDGYMSETLTKQGIVGPYCLVVENKTEIDLWPYVFVFEPMSLSIIPWYLPSPAADQPPLKAHSSLPVGCGDEGVLRFKNITRSVIIYMRVFVTMEKTDFSVLKQYWLSHIENRVRELEFQPVNLELSCDSADDDSEREILSFSSESTWAAKMATVVLKMEGSDNPDSH